TTESWVQPYRYVVDQLRNGKQLNGTPAFVGVGFGTDFTAPGTGGPQPRFEQTAGPVTGGPTSIHGPPLLQGGLCFLADAPNTPARLTYPFVSTSPFASGTCVDNPKMCIDDPKLCAANPTVCFDKSNVPWTGARGTPYDIAFDGVAHIGMIPDFVEELRTM